MKINLSGHHVDLTDNIKSDIAEKFEKTEQKFPTLISLDVIISKAHNKFKTEIRTNYQGAAISATSEHDIMYPSVSGAIKKLHASLLHRKGHLKAYLHQKPQVTTPEIAHEIIQGMQLT
ncbi:ribosome-associated translation inhibitor RaiA [Paraferrimonas sp. SM1919]|uniref:ribosome hibernation-promoting factor, HPF/YfiA family n=1 Tax=Paraferrimonas sp. SM1919 TaxID=2662263 RepID=UPI0013D2870D|nr:ribosome-associated translation inhibitor RaiA [Paraferrimonas sp. SM1919]